MADKRIKKRSGALEIRWQNVLIFAIAIAVFFGSALLFWVFHTNTLRKSVQAETVLSSALLAEDIDDNIPMEMLLSGAADSDLSDDMRMLEDKIENESDVWITDAEGTIYYQYGSEGFAVDRELQALALSAREEATDGGVSIRWVGRSGGILLSQRCFVVRPIYGGELLLVMVNHANSARATQRQQFTLLMVIDVMLMLVAMVVVVNTSVSYRRQLIRLATTDELTGLANRKNFNTEFAEFISSARVPDFSLFLLDIDYFKQINDNYGHAAGDNALRCLAQHIKAMVRETGGFAGRWGGDEFIGVLPTSGEDAHAALCKLCRKIEAAELDDGFRMTISAGVAHAEGETQLMKLSERADLALYESKEHGRNRASLYRPDMKGAPDAAPASYAPAEATVSPVAASVAAEEKQSAEGFRKRFSELLRDKLISSTIQGVRWMAPFVAGGGILIALAFLFDAASVDLSALTVAERASFGSITAQAATLKNIGGITFNYMLPVFAGFMAYGIAGEEAFMTGFVGGYMTINSNAGFIGAMVAGLAAGFITNEVSQFTNRLPGFIRKAAPIIIYPVFNLLLMQVVTLLIIKPVASAVGTLFTSLLQFFETQSSVATGTLSAMMMAFDMGGIVNKVAYNYGVSSIAAGHEEIMASVMIGGMVPPIGLALSVFLFRHKFSQSERDRGLSALFMGLSFITEGALPYVFTDIRRVIPACMLGSAAAGLLSALFGCTLPAPHGGIFVLPVMGHPILYLLALAVGSIITAVTLGRWKKDADGLSE